MAAITGPNLILRARRLTADLDTTHFSDAMIYDWLNDAQAIWAEKTKCLWEFQNITSVTDTQEYSLDATFFPCTAYSVTFDGKPIDPLGWFSDVYAYATDWSTATGQPLKFYIRQIASTPKIGLIPIPSADYAGKTIRIEAYEEPATITSSVAPNIDDNHGKWLPFYVASIMAGIDGETMLEAKYRGTWETELGRAVSLYSNVNPTGLLQQKVSFKVQQ